MKHGDIPDWEKPYDRGGVATQLLSLHSMWNLREVALPELRKVFKRRCCYCTGSEFEKGGVENLTIDHFRPRGRPEFEHLEFDYLNLYYACAGCNRRKGVQWPDPETKERRFVDPCEEAIYPKYLRFRSGGKVVANKPPGRYLLSVFKFGEREGIHLMLMGREIIGSLKSALEANDLKKLKSAIERLGKLSDAFSGS